MITADTTTHPNLSSTSNPAQSVQSRQGSDASGLNDQTTDLGLKAVRVQLYLQRIIDQNKKTGITTGVTFTNLKSGATIKYYDADTEQFAASVNKLPIAALVLNDLRSGKLKFDQVLTWTDADIRGGAGVYDQPGAPKQATVKDLLFDMLNPSGNTAVRVFVNGAFGGADATNARFKAELGLQHTYLQPQGGTSFYVGNTTSHEAVKNVVTLLEGDDQYQQFVKNALTTNIYTDYGVRTQLAGNDYIALANKVGILDDPEGNNRHDVGVIYNSKTGKSYAYAFLNTAPGAATNLPTAQAGVSLADMGRGVLRYSGDKQNGSEKALRDAAPFVEQRVRY